MTIHIKTQINAPVSKAWTLWTDADHIINWYHASNDWHAPSAQNDLCVGGKFLFRMESKDGKIGFDFWGIYNDIDEEKRIAYSLGDGRNVEIFFEDQGDSTIVSQSFEAETENDIELQKAGWQAILNSFKKYAESIT